MVNAARAVLERSGVRRCIRRRCGGGCETCDPKTRMLMGMYLNAVIERDLATGILVGSIPGVPGAHTQGETIEEVRANLAEVIELLQSENALKPESEFIATTALMVA